METLCQKRHNEKLKPSVNLNQSIKILLYVTKISNPTIKVISHKHLVQLSPLYRKHWTQNLFPALFQIVEKLESNNGPMIPLEIAINLQCFAGEIGKKMLMILHQVWHSFIQLFQSPHQQFEFVLGGLECLCAVVRSLSEILLTVLSNLFNWSS